MNLLAWLGDRWNGERVAYSYVPIDPAHVDLGDGRALDTTPIVNGERYYRLWVSEMAIQNDREWFSAWHPAVYGATRFLLGGQEQHLNVIAGPSILTNLAQAAQAKSVALNYPLTPLLPYNGGDVEFEAGLAAIKGSNDVLTLLDVVGRFSKLLNVSQFSQVLSLVEPIAAGVSALFGGDQARPVLRAHNTFTSGPGAGANQLRGGYFAVLGRPAGEVPENELWVVRDRLYRGRTRDSAAPFNPPHFMLFRLESSAERSDWSALSSISEPYEMAIDALSAAIYAPTPDQKAWQMQEAERRMIGAQVAALRAKELTRIVGRAQAIEGIREAFELAKRKLGQGATEASVPRKLADAIAVGPTPQQAATLGELTTTAGLGVTHTARPHGPHEKAAGQEPALAVEEVRRTPHMELSRDEPLEAGASFTVKVYADRLALRQGETGDEIVVHVPTTFAAVDLDVWIAGTAHFAFDGAGVESLRIALRSGIEDTSATFSARVVEHPPDSPARLTAYFQFGGRPCGHVSREVSLGAAAGARAGDARSPVLRVEMNAVHPDLTITITDPRRDRQHLECRIKSPHLPGFDPESRPWNLPSNTADFVKGLMQDFVKPNTTNQGRLLSLNGAGVNFWKAAPKNMQTAFWTLLDQGKPFKTIMIVSQEPYFPWELAMPHRHKDGVRELRKPLGVEFAVGRWIADDNVSPAQQIPISVGLVVAPDYTGSKPKPLAHAQSEALYVLSKVTGTQLAPVDFSSFTAAVSAKSYDLLHVVCHGVDSGVVGTQTIYLEDGELSSVQVEGLDAAGSGLGRRPLVFLNACEVGRPTAALVGIGGFAKAFIDAGASAVIAPLWSVKDKIAPDICRIFYDAVVADVARPFADVLKDVRARAYSADGGEDTYAAYCYYGDPHAARQPHR